MKKFHPDYNPDAFAEIKVGANKGQKAPLQLAEMLHSTSRLIKDKVDITKVDYDVDVLVIGGGGAGSSCAIEANKAGANVMIVTKLRIGDANTMMLRVVFRQQIKKMTHRYSIIWTALEADILLQNQNL